MSHYTFWQMIERLEQIAGMKGYLADHDKEIIMDAVATLRQKRATNLSSEISKDELILRLRGRRFDGTTLEVTMNQAADEIERLRGLLRHIGLTTKSQQHRELIGSMLGESLSTAFQPTAVQDDSTDAARYRWLRQRVEVRKEEAMSGSVRDALCIRIGGAFLDSPASRLRSLRDPNAGETRSRELDAAIDAARATDNQTVVKDTNND